MLPRSFPRPNRADNFVEQEIHQVALAAVRPAHFLPMHGLPVVCRAVRPNEGLQLAQLQRLAQPQRVGRRVRDISRVTIGVELVRRLPRDGHVDRAVG